MEFAYRAVEFILKPLLSLWFKWDMQGLDRLEAGPSIVACNHVSVIDPLAVAYAYKAVGKRARFLAKAELFRNPILRRILTSMGQIPVYRGSNAAGRSLRDAEVAVGEGRSVVIFPESTIGPGLPLLNLKSGAARLAIATGKPITPMAVWGGQDFLSRGHRDLKRGKRISVRVGEEINPGPDSGSEAVDELTRKLGEALTELTMQASGPDNTS